MAKIRYAMSFENISIYRARHGNSIGAPFNTYIVSYIVKGKKVLTSRCDWYL